jgi:hypothetical protein
LKAKKTASNSSMGSDWHQHSTGWSIWLGHRCSLSVMAAQQHCGPGSIAGAWGCCVSLAWHWLHVDRGFDSARCMLSRFMQQARALSAC